MSPCCRTYSIVRVTPITRMCIGLLGTAPKIFDTRLPVIIFLSSRPHRVLVARAIIRDLTGQETKRLGEIWFPPGILFPQGGLLNVRFIGWAIAKSSCATGVGAFARRRRSEWALQHNRNADTPIVCLGGCTCWASTPSNFAFDVHRDFGRVCAHFTRSLA